MPDIRKFLGGYELIREIGRGGFGAVYLSKDKGGKYIALKLLKKTDAKSEIEFLKEPNKNLSNCDLHNIIPILDAYQSESAVFYTMPLADPLYPVYAPDNPLWKGKSLSNLMEEKERNPSSRWFEEREIFDIAKALFNAVMFLNSAGVLHRDIKPSNILFWNGEACLADFSIAKKDDDFENIKELGTDVYRAPQGYIAKDGNPDMWGLAATLFKLITGYSLSRIDRSAAVYPKRGADNLSDSQKERYRHWRRCILRAISENPQQRFVRMKDFRDAFFSDDFSVSKLADAPSPSTNDDFYRIKFNPQRDILENAISMTLKNLEKLQSQASFHTSAAESLGAAKDFIEANDFANAIKCLGLAISAAPSADLYVWRAACRYALKDFYQALSDYDKAISLNANFALAYRGKAHCYAMLAAAEMLKLPEKELDKNPELAENYLANLKLAQINMARAADLGDSKAKDLIKDK